MNGKIILAGFIILAIGFIANIPSIILGMAGSPIKSEGDAMNKILDEFQKTPIVSDNPQSQDIIKNTKGSISLLDSVPTILMIIGALIIIFGLFIPDS